jgi:acetyl esterase/lipase
MRKLLILIFFGLGSSQLTAQNQSGFIKKDLIYGRKDGLALTMVMLSPKGKSNRKAIVKMVSSGWYSDYDWIPDVIKSSETYIRRGYTVFLVMHSSRPMYSILDAIADSKRAVRFVRYHSGEYKIDPKHIGITGASSGGQLSLTVAMDDDKPDRDSKDPVDRVSGRVQAAACFFPPSDFLHWGNLMVDPKNKAILDEADVYAAFEFKEWNLAHKDFILITDQQKLVGIYKEISPIYQISSDDPPILIAHGNADKVVPFSQSERFIEKLKQANITCQLLVKEGGGHGGWNDESVYESAFADWFDKYLK